MTFFFDNQQPQAIVLQLREDGREVVHMREEFSDQGLDDTVWIPIIAERGWILITGDHQILRRRAERAALEKARLIVFFLAKEFNNKTSVVRVRWLQAQWSKIEEAASKALPGDCFLVPLKGRVKPYPLPRREED